VDQARKRAEQLKAEVSLGGDPAADTAKLRAIPTVEQFAKDRYLPHVQERLRAAGNVEAYLRKRILPALGKKALDEVNQQEVAELRRKLVAEGLANGTVNRHLATLRAMFNLALKWELCEGRNPAASPGMLREVHRDKYLSPGETQALFRVLAADPDETAASVLMLLAVTGARRGEALKAKWENVDLERGLLTVPRSKSGRTRHVPLSAMAVAILQRQLAKRQFHPGNLYVFTSSSVSVPLRCSSAIQIPTVVKIVLTVPLVMALLGVEIELHLTPQLDVIFTAAGVWAMWAWLAGGPLAAA